MRFLISLLILIFTLNGSQVRWFGDFEIAHKEALEKDKYMMVLLLEKSNPTCHETVKTLFFNQSYIDEINKKYISVILIKNQNGSYPIEMLYTLTYPTIFFLDSKELFVCEPLMGKITSDILKNYLKQCK